MFRAAAQVVEGLLISTLGIENPCEVHAQRHLSGAYVVLLGTGFWLLRN